MSSEKLYWTQFREWANAAAADFLLLDPSDLPAMAHFVKRMEQQAADISSFSGSPADGARLADGLSLAAARLKAVILKDEPDPAGAMAFVSQAIESIETADQEAECGVTDEHERVDPPEYPGAFPLGVDDSIVSAYVEQQASVLQEMTTLILDFEKDGEGEHISEIRRFIHTMKGESGMVGALPIEKMCHQIEDYLNGPVESILPDTLLVALDWINRAVLAFGDSIPIEGETAMLERLTGEPADAAVDPQAPMSAQDAMETPVDSEGAAEPESIPIGDRDLALDFSAEAQEHFESADENLLILEREPGNTDAIGAVFRAFHTIKGVAGFLGLPPIGDLAHAAETLLDDVRKGRRNFDGPVVEVTFNALDALKTVVEDLRQAAAAGQDLPIRPTHATVLAALHAVLAGESVPASSPAPSPETADATAGRPMKQGTTDGPSMLVEPTVPEDETKPKRVVDVPQTMKIDAVRIDSLLETIGELVIAESIVTGDPDIRALKSVRVDRSLALLGKITRTLQGMGMTMRLVPIDPVFRKMARLVRDLSRKSGKQVDLTIEGGDTEIDKSMVEKLGDPLVHMIRNSMDHGLEPMDERRAQGKSETGNLVLRARHHGGNIHIDIEDDGRGLDRKAILDKAIERGLLDSRDGLSDQDVFQLIFQPGFSTSKQITEISGRGVGMDVVRRNIQALRGNVLIRSTPGEGSVFTLALPLTTAIIDGMLALLGSETYVLPTLSILEAFRPDPGRVHNVVGKGEVVSFRGNLLPLFRLSRLLGISEAKEDPLHAIVIVVEEFGRHWGFMVDDIQGKQQVVIKSLGDGMGSVPGIVGASILADGRPGLILDVGGVIRLASKESGQTR